MSIAVRILPGSDVRSRYRQEFIAELYSVERARQLRHACGIASAAVFLRHAIRVRDRDILEELMTPQPHKPILCRLHLRHHWVVKSTEDGERFQTCSKCGKDRDIDSNRYHLQVFG